MGSPARKSGCAGVLSIVACGLLFFGAVGAIPAWALEAPREGMASGHWFSAVKQFLGTAYEEYDSGGGYSSGSPTAPLSKVWFTGSQGVLSEVMWPSVDTPQTRDSQFLVSDGKSFFFEERRDSNTRVEWLAQGIPAFRVINEDRQGRFVIDKTIFADPDRDTVMQVVHIVREVPGLHFYYLHKPAVSNTPMGNSAEAVVDRGLYAWQGSQAQAVLFSTPMRQASAGFEGASDGWMDLHEDLRMDNRFTTATRGNVTLMAWLDIPETVGASEVRIAVGFGSDRVIADSVASASLAVGPVGARAALGRYAAQWQAYQRGLVDLGGQSGDGGTLYRASIAVLKSSEDKTAAGAIIASPSVPWGAHQEDNNSEAYRNRSRAHQTGGYHLIWPRDLYQMATTFLAAGDPRSAVASLGFLRGVQYGPDSGEWEFGFRKHARNGSFPQNCWSNGEVFWAGLQMDEVSMPIVLAHRLWKEGLIRPGDYWDMVKRAADFVQEFGPWSPQERWEEAKGASPSTIAAEIAALWDAAELALELGDTGRALRYRQTADAWAFKPGDNVQTWTFTSTGAWGDHRYYTRLQGAGSVDEIWNPDSDATVNLANGAGLHRQKDIVDGGFLELVRFGIRPASDEAVLSSLPELDEKIRIDLPGVGPAWRRYLHDRYNYADDTGAQTEGMLWPFLTGERGHFELQLARERSQATGSKPGSGEDLTAARAAVAPYVRAMERMATPTAMLPEQVWDAGPGAGQPTGAATPLGWTHGEYIKLLRSKRDGAVFDLRR